MRESSRPATFDQSHNRFVVTDRVSPVYDARMHSTSRRPVFPSAPGGHSKRHAMESFGHAITELFECSRCFVATISGEGAIAEQVRVGHATAGRISEATIAQVACRLAPGNDILSMAKSDASLARSIIGLQNMPSGHSIVGRISSGDDENLLFIAGWRASPVASADIAALSRAARIIWATATRLTYSRREHSDIQDLLEELVSPAFVVDENLRLHEVNHDGRKLLLMGKFLRSDGGLLAGVNDSITRSLREAVCNALTSDQRWMNTTIVLSTEHQQFAFAWVGIVPTRRDARQVLVIVPRVDEAMGAGRIAAAFGLNCIEEKIIARILHGDGPRGIGADLGLTEATVRTYTKRIMLKLGINRQSELFLLYILTLSPFGAGRPERALASASTFSRLGGRVCISPSN